MKSFLIHALRARALVWPLILPTMLLFFLCETVSGQSIVKQTIASAGSTMRWDRGWLTMTIGQAAAERIVNSAVDIHGGFLPPRVSASVVAGLPMDREPRIHSISARDNFFVEMPTLPSLSLELYDMSGRLYLLERNVSGQVTIDLADIPAGGYFLCILSGGDVVLTKLIMVIR